MAEYMTFLNELNYKYNDTKLYQEIVELFDSLPICALVSGCKDKDFFCVHGGISPYISTLDEIEDIDRFCEPDNSGALCDFIWADPAEELEDNTNSIGDIMRWQNIEFVDNDKRQTSFIFGYKALKKFLDDNYLSFVVRAHEVVDDGYKEHYFYTNEVSCITLFSAPNYCDMYENKGAVMYATKDGYSFKQFSCVKHPFYLPDFCDAFSYSVPSLMENLVTILTEIVIDIKEENPDEMSAEEIAMNADIDVKAKNLREAMSRREKRVSQLTRKRMKMLAVEHRIFVIIIFFFPSKHEFLRKGCRS